MQRIKSLDTEINDSYKRQCAGTRISIMDIPKLFADVRRDVLTGKLLDLAVAEAIKRYQV